MNIRLFFHPVFCLQSRNAPEVGKISCNKNKFFLDGCGGNKHIHISNLQASAFQLPAYLSVFLETHDMIGFKKHCNLTHVIEMLLLARLKCTKIQFGKSNVRNLAIVNSNFFKMLKNTTIFLEKRDTRICVKKVNPACKHTYQVSILRTISALWRKSEPSPSHSPLILDRKALRRSSGLSGFSTGRISLFANHSRSLCESDSPCRYVHRLFNANEVI